MLKKTVFIILFIFWVLVTAIITAGLLYRERNKSVTTGASAVIGYCGQDATTAFSGHPSSARSLLAGFYLGDLL